MNNLYYHVNFNILFSIKMKKYSLCYFRYAAKVKTKLFL
jgi:hypothetical protein